MSGNKAIDNINKGFIRRKISMKKLIPVIVTLVLVVSATAAFSLDRGHTFITGIVDSTGERTDAIPASRGGTVRTETYKTVTIAGVMYKIDKNCIIRVETGVDGRFIQRNGSFNDILPGKSVTAKRIARTLHEIIIEEWKR